MLEARRETATAIGGSARPTSYDHRPEEVCQTFSGPVTPLCQFNSRDRLRAFVDPLAVPSIDIFVADQPAGPGDSDHDGAGLRGGMSEEVTLERLYPRSRALRGPPEGPP